MSITGRLIDAAAAELKLSDGAIEKDGLKERVALSFERIGKPPPAASCAATACWRRSEQTAPFVGLFGTVWGIMNSFIGISKSQTTNLRWSHQASPRRCSRPALGLAAAIPAVVIYNVFSAPDRGLSRPRRGCVRRNHALGQPRPRPARHGRLPARTTLSAAE